MAIICSGLTFYALCAIIVLLDYLLLGGENMQRTESNGPHSYADYDISFQSRLRKEWKKVNPYYRGRPDYDTGEWLISEKMPIFMMVGIAALLVWIITALLKLMIPAKWGVVVWIVGALSFVGKWVFLICVALIVVMYIVSFVSRIVKHYHHDN